MFAKAIMTQAIINRYTKFCLQIEFYEFTLRKPHIFKRNS